MFSVIKKVATYETLCIFAIKLRLALLDGHVTQKNNEFRPSVYLVHRTVVATFIFRRDVPPFA